VLNPFEFAVITVDEARHLMKFIEESTGTPSMPRNYDKMGKRGVLQIYNSLRQFVEKVDHYRDNLEYFDPSSYQRSD